jgi:hypothetical protein
MRQTTLESGPDLIPPLFGEEIIPQVIGKDSLCDDVSSQMIRAKK